MKNNRELKPCPFCGGKVYMNRYSSKGIPSGDDGYTAEIKCLNCHLNMKFWALQEDWARNSATEAWNNRKPMERIVERLEKEEIALEDNYGDYVLCVPVTVIKEIVKAGGING